jgi:hypothetical protein
MEANPTETLVESALIRQQTVLLQVNSGLVGIGRRIAVSKHAEHPNFRLGCACVVAPI